MVCESLCSCDHVVPGGGVLSHHPGRGLCQPRGGALCRDDRKYFKLGILDILLPQYAIINHFVVDGATHICQLMMICGVKNNEVMSQSQAYTCEECKAGLDFVSE